LGDSPRWVRCWRAIRFVDEVIPFERNASGIAALWRRLRNASNGRFELAVDFQGLIQSALIAAAARPEKIVGWTRRRREKVSPHCSIRRRSGRVPRIVSIRISS